MTNHSPFLYARPSFLEGMGRILDFGDNLTEFNRTLTGDQADYLATLSDWHAVGGDLRAAVASHQQRLKKSTDGTKR